MPSCAAYLVMKAGGAAFWTYRSREELQVALGGIREARRTLELLVHVAGELNEAPRVNIQVNAQWVELRTLILTTLDASPHRQNKPWHGHRKRAAVVELREDLALSTNRVAFTSSLGVEPAE